MAGVKQFDEGAVIEAAMTTIWRNGFAETAMADLAEAGSVQRGSLYNSYGGKEQILLLALARYADRQGVAVRAALAQPGARDAVAGFLSAHVARMESPENPSGCLMCQTALECDGRPEIADAVRMYFKRTESALRDRFQTAIDDGELPAASDPRKLARFYLGVTRGMAVLHRAYGDLEPVKDMAEVALKTLP